MKFGASVVALSLNVLVASWPATITGQVTAGVPIGHWTLGSVSIQIGADEGEAPERLWNVAGVFMTRSGSLVIGDAGSDELRFFDARTGRYLKTVAGRGQGPGEIEGLWSLLSAGDEMVAVDASGWASRFDDDGKFLGRTPPPVSARGLRLERVGFFDDGTELTYAVEPNSDIPPGRTTIWMRVVAVTGGEPRLLLRYKDYVATRKGNARPSYLVFGPLAALVPLGDRFCVGFPEAYLIECFTQSGEPLQKIVRKEWDLRDVTSEHRSAYFAVNDAANPGPRGAGYRRYLRENAQFADEFPPFGRFVAGPSSELWVGPQELELDTPVLNPTPREETVWSVFDKGGAWLSDIVLPPRFRLMAAGKDYVVGVSRDEFDVESVVVYRLMRSE